MTNGRPDLVVLAADKCIQQAIEGLLTRRASLGIREVTCDVFIHPERDPGCLRKAAPFLRPMHQLYRHALVIFDLEGCGSTCGASTDIEAQVLTDLSRSGWEIRAGVVVVDPEIEAWVWSDSPVVDRCLGWSGRSPSLRRVLVDNGWCASATEKPGDPKKALRWALREVQEPFSSSIFGALARSVGIDRCTDPAFLRLKSMLIAWFGSDMDTRA